MTIFEPNPYICENSRVYEYFASYMDIQADRSRLLNRQKKDRSEAEKDVKKKKGAMKVTAQKVLEDLIETQEK